MKLSTERGAAISPELFGLFFEDINYAADGGLYAQLLENPCFEAMAARGTVGSFYMEPDYGYGWSAVAAEGEEPPRLRFVTGMPLSEVNPHYLRFTACAAGQGFANKAFDGISVKKGLVYHAAFYARCTSYCGDAFTVQLRRDGAVLAQGRVKTILPMPYLPFCDTPEPTPVEPERQEQVDAIRKMDPAGRCRQHCWNRYSLDLTASEDCDGAEFAVILEDAGTAEFDFLSLMPGDAVAGLFRKDLFDALQAMQPGFIRFPGGCIVEGVSLYNRYRWKQTVGPLEERHYIPNLWAFDDNRSLTDEDQYRADCHYGQSYGLGFYEYFLLCELLGAKPLPVLNIGAACQFRTTEMVTSDSPAFREYIQDALDLIEFANGAADTRWGGLRCRMGHPEPFGLTMLSPGNEQWQTGNLDLYERHRAFAEAILAKYPDIRLVGTAGPILDSPIARNAWAFYREGEAQRTGFCYAVDEHYYVSPQWMYDHVTQYDEYPRNVGVFAGEYAAHTANRENNMESALAEAALLTGIERNADVVKLASYAPLFNRIGHSQWAPDMIWFDGRNVFLTPNYQVQRLFASFRGENLVPLEGQEKALREDGVYISLTTRDNTLILKAVNTGTAPYELPLERSGIPFAGQARLHTLTGTGTALTGNLVPSATIMPEACTVVDTQQLLCGSLTLPAESFTVAELL